MYLLKLRSITSTKTKVSRGSPIKVKEKLNETATENAMGFTTYISPTLFKVPVPMRFRQQISGFVTFVFFNVLRKDGVNWFVKRSSLKKSARLRWTSRHFWCDRVINYSGLAGGARWLASTPHMHGICVHGWVERKGRAETFEQFLGWKQGYLIVRSIFARRRRSSCGSPCFFIPYYCHSIHSKGS